MFRWLFRTLRKEAGHDRQYGPIVVQGRQLSCNVCDHQTFWAYQIQLHTPLMTFLDLEEWNRLADCAICAKCGYIHWFMPPDTRYQEEQKNGTSDEVRETQPIHQAGHAKACPLCQTLGVKPLLN